MFKTNKYIDARAMGPTQEEYDDSSESPQGGHPLIRADWKSEDSLRAATGRTWATGSAGISTDQAWKDENGLVLAFDNSGTTESIEVSLNNTMYNNHRASYISLNWPDVPTFVSLLEKLNAGDPYFRKLIRDDFVSGDTVNASVPGIVDTTSTTSFIDLTTEVPSPDPGTVDDGYPAFAVNIKPVYNGYNEVFEREFPDTGLNETALPNYYMLTYWSPREELNVFELPRVYKLQISLLERAYWLHGSINEGGDIIDHPLYGAHISYHPFRDYFLEYSKGLASIDTPAEVADFNNDMERYKVIAVRPQSKAGIDDLSNDEDRLRLLPYYIDLNFRSPTVSVDANNSGVADTETEPIPDPGHGNAAFPYIRKALQELNLFDAVVSFIIERDTGMPYHLNAFPSSTSYVSADRGTEAVDLICLLNDMLGVSTSPLTFYQEYNKLWPIPGDVESRSMLRATSIGLPADNDPLKASGTYLIAPEETIAFGISPFGPYTAAEATAEAGGNIDRPSMQAKIDAAAAQQIFQPGDTTAAASTIRSFQQLLAGEPAHSETLVYKIEKRNADTGNLVQTFYMPNVDGGFRYIDSQVLYGVRYQYDIMPIRAVVGNQYQYTNLMVLPEEVTELGTGHALGNALGFYQDTDPGSVYGPLIAANLYGMGSSTIFGTYLADDADTPIYTEHTGKFIFKAPNATSRFGCIDDSQLGSDQSAIWMDKIKLDLIGAPNASGVTNNVDGGATAKRIDLTLTEAQQCAGTQTIGGAMTFGGALTLGALPMCSNGSFETWVHDQENAGWPAPAIGWTNSGAPSNYSSRLTSNNITAEDILTAPIMQQWIGSVDISEAKRIFIDIYKGICTEPPTGPWTYTG